MTVVSGIGLKQNFLGSKELSSKYLYSTYTSCGVCPVSICTSCRVSFSRRSVYKYFLSTVFESQECL